LRHSGGGIYQRGVIYTKAQPHQAEGATFLLNRAAAIVGAKTGKGKTLTVLACLHEHVRGKMDYAVVFMPPEAYKNVWAQQVARHSDMSAIRFPQAQALWEAGGTAALCAHDLVLCKYGHATAKNYRFLLGAMAGRIAVFDEAHKLKNPMAKLTRLMANMAAGCRARWAVTATAMGNSPMDIWGLMAFLDPAVFGPDYQFKREFCILEDKVIRWKHQGMYTCPETGQAKKRMVPVTRKEVVGIHAHKVKAALADYMWTIPSDLRVAFHEVRYAMAPDEERAYLTAAMGVLDKAKEKGFAQRVPDLQRVADGSLGGDGKPTRGYRNSKYSAFRDLLAKLLASGKSAVLFAEFNETFGMLHRLLAEDLPGVPVYRVSGSRREYREGEARLPCVVMVTRAGTESLNLPFASAVLCYSVPYSVNGFIQVVGRITRMDSEHLGDLRVYLPMCETNVDRYKCAYLKENAEAVNALLGDDANLPKKGLADRRKADLAQMRKELMWRTRPIRARTRQGYDR
jgi:hypothetical protein